MNPQVLKVLMNALHFWRPDGFFLDTSHYCSGFCLELLNSTSLGLFFCNFSLCTTNKKLETSWLIDFLTWVLGIPFNDQICLCDFIFSNFKEPLRHNSEMESISWQALGIHTEIYPKDKEDTIWKRNWYFHTSTLTFSQKYQL